MAALKEHQRTRKFPGNMVRINRANRILLDRGIKFEKRAFNRSGHTSCRCWSPGCYVFLPYLFRDRFCARKAFFHQSLSRQKENIMALQFLFWLAGPCQLNFTKSLGANQAALRQGSSIMVRVQQGLSGCQTKHVVV